MKNIKNGQLTLIRHVKTKRYLHASIEPIKGKESSTDRFQVYASIDLVEPYCYWIIKTQEQMMSKIRLGDQIQLQNVITQLYLSSDEKCKSKITKQGLVYQSLKASNWLIVHSSPQQYPVQSEYIDGALRLINSDGRALHSHNCFFKSGSLSNKAEVSGFPERDDNDFWEIISKDDPEYLIYRTPEIQNRLIPIQQLKKVIIRNYLTGYSLHSHSIANSNGTQEVSAFRDRDGILYLYISKANDLWIITYKQMEKDPQKFIIQLQHCKTGGYLFCQKNTKNYSKSGLQVYCTQTKPNEYIWELQMMKHQDLYLNEVFIMNFRQNGYFLSQSDSNSDVTKSQKQISVIQQSSTSSYWMIEYQQD